MASPQPVWGADFAFPTKIPASLENQTVRQIVRISLGGSQIRLVLSNAYGDRPLHIGAASVALAEPTSSTTAGAIKGLTFGGKQSVDIPPGAPAISDPVDLRVEDQAQLSVSIYLPQNTPLTTFHWDGRQTAWFGPGDLTRTSPFTATRTTDARVILSQVLVDTPNEGAVVIIGDSITDGDGATIDADTRWTDFLAKRLAPQRVAVLNAGISGGRLLQDKMGVSAHARLDRDVFAQPNIKAVIVLMGINDISWPGTPFAPKQASLSSAKVIAAYQQIIEMAHAHNVRVIGATLTPFEGALSGTKLSSYYSPAKDTLRQGVNEWIRRNATFDAVIDFDARLRDPVHPARLKTEFDSGDHLHPGDNGNEAMAEAIDLKTFIGD